MLLLNCEREGPELMISGWRHARESSALLSTSKALSVTLTIVSRGANVSAVKALGGNSMLQIIGWLGCLYLFIRSASMGVSREFRNDEGTMIDGAAYLMVLGIAASIGFALWLGAQGEMFPSAAESAIDEYGLSSSEVDCINAAQTPDEVSACME